ncbi:MAG: quinoprotein glucose dehydrogenase [Acidobacteria bacterium]|nr:MAG: quinoprotein glucose dehydrogenase [Acidobacteriota bacterium]PYQ85431.1 MAG: quinoprotein glucose dehydrogenase [Acidobacteriota bacterium]
MRLRVSVLAVGVGVVWAALAPRVSTQAPGFPSLKNGDWFHYTADMHGSRYSPLDQINADNFNKLEVAWRFKTDNFGTFPEYKLEGTPLAIRGILYTTAGTRRDVIALDGRTGEIVWVHSMREGKRAAVAPRQLSGRGVSYWTDGKGDERIVYVTTGYRLVELNAKTGAPVASFGKDGIIDLKLGAVKGKGEQIDLETGEIGVHSTPGIVKDTIIVGSAMREGATVPTHNNTKGLVRAFDARTGKLLWTFNTIPRPGEFGSDTWENESWAINGNTGVWTQITADEEAGLVYLPVETPTSDYYGGHRPGNNLFAETLVCVDLKTGQRKWHFQFTHHPIWNFDMSSAPLIADVNVNGRPRKVVAVPSKQGWLYVFDRITGEPVWPIVEKPVPQSDVPGEKTSPTQPHPPDSLRYARNAFKVPDDLIDFTPELRQAAIERSKFYKWADTPFAPSILGNVNGPLYGAITVGTATNWPGGGYDPENHIAFAPAGNMPGIRTVVPPPPGFSDIRYVSGIAGEAFREVLGPGDCCAADSPRTAQRAAEARQPAPAAPQPQPAGGGAGTGLNVQGLPMIKPPYGVIAAIDLDKGALKWQTPHGDTPDAVRNHPMLRGKNIPKTGQAGTAGVGLLVTKTVVVMGDPQVTTTPEHPRGAMLRAYNKMTGEQVGAVWMPAPQSGSPMTYAYGGKQYIIVAISGGSYSGEYLAFSLPGTESRPTSQH